MVGKDNSFEITSIMYTKKEILINYYWMKFKNINLEYLKVFKDV